jgi:Family of unknown function (DUF5670)
MLWIVFVVLLVLWLVGFTLHFGTGLMHLLVVLPLIVLLYKLITDTLQPEQGK